MLSSKIRVAVLRGGPSHEYEVSLNTGANILSLLREWPDKYEPVDVFISKDGDWHLSGLVEEPHRVLRHADVVWNGLHGAYGEDGQVQKILEGLKIPFTGSGTMASALAMNKDIAKAIYQKHSLLTPRHEVLEEGTDVDDQLIFIFRNYLHPVIVKPAGAGSSIGVHLAHTFHELKEAIAKAFKYSKKVLVEEFIRGKEATCGVIEDARGEKLYALLPIEIRKQGHIWGYEDKYSGNTEEICPGNFTSQEKKVLEDMAKKAHEALGLRHYSRSDFIVTPKSKIYILETNSLPGFTKESLLPKALHAAGWPPRDFVDHCIKLALRN